jgi:hypothetical protein
MSAGRECEDGTTFFRSDVQNFGRNVGMPPVNPGINAVVPDPNENLLRMFAIRQRGLARGPDIRFLGVVSWYKDFKRGLHETAFELIEIPYLRQSGKNSVDFRMVVASCCLPPRPRPAS